MRIKLYAVLMLLASAVVIYALLSLTNALGNLSQINAAFAAFAALLYLLSIFVWNHAWVEQIRTQVPDVPTWPMNWAGFAAVIGIVFPLNVGPDFFRGLFGRRWAGFRQAFAASLSTKFFKSVIILASSITIFVAMLQQGVSQPLVVGILFGVFIIVLMMSIVLAVRKRSNARKIFGILTFTKRVKREEIEGFADILSKSLCTHRLEVWGLLALSWLLEFAAFAVAFIAVTPITDAVRLYLIFSIMLLLSMTPWPRGIGAVEAGGFLLLQGIGAQTAALFIALWAIVRIWVPLLAATMATYRLGLGQEIDLH